MLLDYRGNWKFTQKTGYDFSTITSTRVLGLLYTV